MQRKIYHVTLLVVRVCAVSAQPYRAGCRRVLFKVMCEQLELLGKCAHSFSPQLAVATLLVALLPS